MLHKMMTISFKRNLRISHRVLNKRAVTLTELLIAGIIVGVILLAIVSVDLALRQSERGTSRNTLVAARTSAMMLHITKSIGQGAIYQSGTTPEDFSGIRVSGENLWIYYDNNTPDDTSDDYWLHYENDSNTLKFCHVANPTDTCTSAIGSVKSLGAIVSFQPSLNIDSSSGTQQFYVTIRLTNRFNISQAADPLDNPDFVLETNVYPNTSTY